MRDKKDTGNIPSTKKGVDSRKNFSATGHIDLLIKVLKKVTFLN